MCYAINLELLNKPNKPLDQLNLDCIPSSQRFNQAVYGIHKKLSHSASPFIPSNYQKKDGITLKDIKVLGESGIEDLVEQLFSLLSEDELKLQESNPSIYLVIYGDYGGHALYIRFDEENKRYVFRDPNFLTAERVGIDYQTGIAWLKDVLSGLLHHGYDDTHTLQNCPDD